MGGGIPGVGAFVLCVGFGVGAGGRVGCGFFAGVGLGVSGGGPGGSSMSPYVGWSVGRGTGIIVGRGDGAYDGTLVLGSGDG